MGVTDYGRGNKAITCRALGRRTRDSLFSWGGEGRTAEYSSVGRVYHLLYMWYHALLPSLRLSFYMHSFPAAIRAMRLPTRQEAPKLSRIRYRYHIYSRWYTAAEEYPACFWRKGDGSGEFYFDDLEEKLIINEMLKL